MARNKPYARVPGQEFRGYVKDRKISLNREGPTRVHSEGIKPYNAIKQGANFADMEDFDPYTFGPYPGYQKPPPVDQRPNLSFTGSEGAGDAGFIDPSAFDHYTSGPYMGHVDVPTLEGAEDTCSGNALLNAIAPPNEIDCSDFPGVNTLELTALGHDRAGNLWDFGDNKNRVAWDFCFPNLSPPGSITVLPTGDALYVAPTCSELSESEGSPCRDGQVSVCAQVELCDGVVLLSNTLIDIHRKPSPSTITITGPVDAQVGSSYSTGEDVTWSISGGSIDVNTGVITGESCGSDTITATLVCDSGVSDTFVIRWINGSKYFLMVDCGNCPPTAGGCWFDYACTQHGLIEEGAWKTDNKDGGCTVNSDPPCDCSMSLSGRCTDRVGGCPPGTCSRKAAQVKEWKWCCNAGC